MVVFCFLSISRYIVADSLKSTAISFVNNLLKHVVTENSCLAHKILENILKGRLCNCIDKMKLLSNNILYQVTTSAT